MAVDRATGELRSSETVPARPAGHAQLLAWARELGGECVWALEDVRGVSRGLERFLVARDERVLRVPPKLMAGARRGARSFGKSDSIDALAIARAALAHDGLPVAVEDEAAREVKLLVNHRETLVRQRSEAQDRLRWLLHAIDPELRVPAGALDRKVWLNRLARRLARSEQTVEVRIARDLVRRCRQLTANANTLERELAVLVANYAPQLLELKGCGVLIAAKLIGETAGVGRFRHEAQLARLAGVAPVDCSSGQRRRHRLNRFGNRELNSALHKIAVVQGRWEPRARAYLERRQAEGKTRREHCAASSATSSESYSASCAKQAPGAPRWCSRSAAARSASQLLPERLLVLVLMPVPTAPAGCDTGRAER